MEIRYRKATFLYDLIDVVYFRRKQGNPRAALSGFVPCKPVRVLDVCAGTGSNSLAVARRRPDAEITALDLSANMLKIAERKFRKAGIGNIQTAVADACDTRYEDGSFDVVILSLILHELDNDLQKAVICESKRILRADGRIIVLEWERPRKLFQRFKFSFLKPLEPASFIPFLQKDLSVYFRSLGLTVLEKQGYDYTQILVLSNS